jgi:putative oxidoreductase
MLDFCKKWTTFLNVTVRDQLDDVSLLLLRLTFGLSMLFAHGWRKWENYDTLSQTFPDPLGVGSALSVGLAVFAEVVCAALLTLGLFTRFAALNLFITMAVAFFIVHGDDPFADKEMALLFMIPYLVLMLRGAGSLSIDRFLIAKR